MIGSCLLQYGYSFKSKNNCYSVYMNKTFCGHTPKVNGLLNLDRSDTHTSRKRVKREAHWCRFVFEPALMYTLVPVPTASRAALISTGSW